MLLADEIMSKVDVFESLNSRECLALLEEIMLRTLTERESCILRLHYGLEKRAHTFREISTKFGFTPGRAQQINEHALRKLRRNTRLSDRRLLNFIGEKRKQEITQMWGDAEKQANQRSAICE